LNTLASGPLHKMAADLGQPIGYRLRVGEVALPLNAYLGQPVQLRYLGQITCCHCGRVTKKSFDQGYCYPCFKRLARCDSCIVSPEKCHYFAGTCREPEWAESHCMQDHFVYLANSSGVKVGITRGTQIPTRWIDQGATQAMPVMRVKTRQQAGFAEVIIKRHVADRTHWQRMLKREAEPCDLGQIWSELRQRCAAEFAQLQQDFGLHAIALLDEQPVVELSFPVLAYPDKVVALNFDKQAMVAGKLQGIKGQYLMLDTGVINIRKFTSYHVDFLA